ncbi:recombinase family protein [Kineosporia sp. NBRC 101731]|uniref:recombinase family protein n=1 Tax=Kineosporia sp. NBRC 101731 TaxID=3032199 RepID=UPI0024A3944B|nr:recombinase family protein [Kineosporia sp. NBRC 101731]GLY32383.1 hypothetical protein Kisp02_57480 [Kineosporia sp. NBRC 101731]
MNNHEQETLFDLPPTLTTPDGLAGGALADWSTRGSARRGQPRWITQSIHQVTCFAFYGRVSTTEYQDPQSSKGWQYDSARDLIGDAGQIVAEYFDVGCSRRLAWSDRPQARRLLERLSHPDRNFDAIVIGEAERAFCAGQLSSMSSLFTEHGIRIWLPELNGPLETNNPIHQAVILELGARSRREVLRARFRTTAAMRTQTREQGRYLGGRPPYGYRLVDAGPHPNRAHARWGRRLRKLDPDTRTAPTVARIFRERLTGRSVSSIARQLNEAGISCPSAADTQRNPHRPGNAWTDTAVATILANPRYTGHQVWNRQGSQHIPVNASIPDGTVRESGRRRVQRWNDPQDWVISIRAAHPALVSPEDFLAVQGMHTERSNDTSNRSRTYRLASLVRCNNCLRKMDSHWVHGRPGYRCRHGHRSSRPTQSGTDSTLYLREDELLDRLLTGQLLPTHVTDPQGTAHHLRQHQLTIQCDHTTLLLTGPGQTS